MAGQFKFCSASPVGNRLATSHLEGFAVANGATIDADAVTLCLRAGAELKHASGLAFLAEAEGTLALDDHYNAFAFPIADSQRRTGYAVVADPMNVELNRLQLQYKSKPFTLTLVRPGRGLDLDELVAGAGVPVLQAIGGGDEEQVGPAVELVERGHRGLEGARAG